MKIKRREHFTLCYHMTCALLSWVFIHMIRSCKLNLQCISHTKITNIIDAIGYYYADSNKQIFKTKPRFLSSWLPLVGIILIVHAVM